MAVTREEEASTMVWPPADLEELLIEAGKVLRAAGAREVYVFGSAAEGRMHERSDIDLAVTGLPPRDFIPAMARVGNVFGRSVDLVDLDLDSPFIAYLKAREGRLRRVA
jgi:predicted nucleotidyltransferase